MDQSVAMAALKGGLQKNDLLFSLKKKYPKDFADLLARAEGYARAEEAFKIKDEETMKERQAGDSSKPAVELDRILELLPDTGMSGLFPELISREARTIEFGGALPPEDSTVTLLSTHRKLKC